MKQDLWDMTIDQMQEFAVSMGEKSYRGRQLFRWVHTGESCTMDDLLAKATDLSKDFREDLREKAILGSGSIEEVRRDASDGTMKILVGFEPEDSIEAVESVFMKYRYGNTLCVSSQIGCRMGCGFCASALGGFVRDLDAGEMIAQVMLAEKAAGEKIDHIVIMGMGEPFDNYENVRRFLEIMHDPAGRNMSWRNMTVSTSGVIPGIVAFGQDFPQVNLAISLHRAENEERSRLMPVNRRYHLDDLIEAAKEYTRKTHRRITFEYALMAGENDGAEDAQKLAALIRGMLCHVNLIPLNEVSEIGISGSSRESAEKFMKVLEDAGIPTTLRRKLGSDIDGACGQLRLRRKNKEK